MAFNPESEELFPIRTVASLTGVNPITLRAWERRYGLIKPSRTDSGHRLYSKKNIEMINRAVELQKQGISIGRAAQLLRQHLGTEDLQKQHSWTKLRNEMLQAIGEFCETRLNLIYEDVLTSHSIQKVIRHLIVPVLDETGRRWQTGEMGVAEEHFFAVYLRNKLGALFHHRTRLTRGRKILVACMPGELHEVGMLLFALAAHDRGYRPVMLGANMPLDDLPSAVDKADCSAIVLSASCQPPLQALEQLERLAGAVSVPVFLGGGAMADSRIRTSRVVNLGADIDAGLQELSHHIGPTAKAARLQ
ncbi:MAG: MerR family transcriptional regulator [Gammaproteobacteria bacterium]|nr:MerR family transcriptional regulator [Gammaproteobacteria bacterium]NNF62140.1 MerR family transcriptional regulator [Gammaproteobacteria bacterium]